MCNYYINFYTWHSGQNVSGNSKGSLKTLHYIVHSVLDYDWVWWKWCENIWWFMIYYKCQQCITSHSQVTEHNIYIQVYLLIGTMVSLHIFAINNLFQFRERESAITRAMVYLHYLNWDKFVHCKDMKGFLRSN